MVDLARRLRSLVWSWRMDDLIRLLAVFGWRHPAAESADHVWFDAGFGSGSCDLYGCNGDAERIEIAVTALAADDESGRSDVRAAFERMAAALIRECGQPSGQVVDVIPEVWWAGEETALLLTDLSVMVRLCLVTNAWLAER
ncbi:MULTISPECIES: DUF6301 family protein [unclassified Nocardia]|uniref:DUF6301 family protein n=1 Tax=unclassified Nocardia TaxID=2637762 RepID=UPI001CE4358D|nr:MULTISPECIES: DUF6301 family protein [unclassified Nocardia]